MTDSETLARTIAAAALDKKAGDLVVLDMRGLSSFTDFFLIASANSEPQLKAITGGIRERVRDDLAKKPLSEDGFPVSQWVVLDYGDVIVHLFRDEKRRYYALEDLWSDAPRLEIGADVPA